MAEYDRLTAQDMSFLLAETPTSYMHVAATQIFERGDLSTEDGGLDFESIKKATASVLHRIPRYRQKLQWSPIFERPVWVDDRDFNLDYHMRHTALPRPGNLAQLKRLSARVMAQQLDRHRPLWEMWIVEGLEGGRFGVISKVHHCMVDGVSGVDLAQMAGFATALRPGARGHPGRRTRVEVRSGSAGRYRSYRYLFDRRQTAALRLAYPRRRSKLLR